jgi:hypothetical protein
MNVFGKLGGGYPVEGFGARYNALEYSTSPDEKAADSYTSFLINKEGGDAKCKKVFGFDGLYCEPYLADNKLDIYSEAKGSLDCMGSGLSNSKGSLCLDKKMLNLLSSRGGNVTCPDSQIGK